MFCNSNLVILGHCYFCTRERRLSLKIHIFFACALKKLMGTPRVIFASFVNVERTSGINGRLCRCCQGSHHKKNSRIGAEANASPKRYVTKRILSVTYAISGIYRYRDTYIEGFTTPLAYARQMNSLPRGRNTCASSKRFPRVPHRTCYCKR